MADDQTVGSPLWWLKRLKKQLDERREQMLLFDRYYRGDHPLPFLTEAHRAKMVNEFRRLLKDSRSNFMRLVVDAVEERLRVEGFRLSAETDPVADRPSWAIWQANQMDAESQAAFVEALVKGVSYLSVWSAPPGGKYPQIAVEDPTETIVAYVPGTNYRQRAAALKLWDDDETGLRRANVYVPDGIWKYRARGKSTTPAWEPLADDEFVANRLKVVPIVPLRNRPRLLCEGESELSDVYNIQNQINGLLFLQALAAYFSAHRQRFATGLPLMEDENGVPVEPFDSAVDRLWTAESPDAKFGEFSQTDLGGYSGAIEQRVLHLAVTTRTPRHYLIQQGQSPSGDAIQSAESGLVKKVERKQRPFGEGLEETMRLARRFSGEPDAPVDSEIVWADPQTETLATVTDAVIKQFTAGLIPWEAALEKLGYSQTQIGRYSTMRAGDALLREILAPTPATVQPPTIVP